MGFLNRIFKKKVLPTADLSGLITDMHSHLIPGIDDGAATEEDSLNMITELYDIGYRKLITTPHIMSDHYKNTPDIILAGLKKIQNSLKNIGLPMQIEAAAEYYLDFEFEGKISTNDLLTFGDNYLLFELSYINEPDQLDAIIFKMRTEGYKPVLAHVERYPYWHNKYDKLEKLIDQGVLFQLNINSLSGQYSPRVKKIAEGLIDKNMISFLGTDCHNMNYLNNTKKALVEPALHKLLQSGKLLNNTL